MSENLRSTLQISTRVLYDELTSRGISVDILHSGSSLLEYTTPQGVEHFLFSTCSDKSSATGVIIADDKTRTALVAKRLNIPLPAQTTCRDIRAVRKFLTTHQQIVIKPVLGSGGKGVSTNLTDHDQIERAYHYAKNYDHAVIVQEHIEGEDVRLLIVGGIFCSAVIRKPASVTGDGISSIKDLIAKANVSELRNNTTLSSLMHINQAAATRFLGEHMATIPALAEEVRVVGPANVSMGGSLHEATHLVTSEMIADAEAITNKLSLGLCGVDMMWNRTTNGHHLIEVNATPGIDIHNDPFSGTSSDCVSRYADWLLS